MTSHCSPSSISTAISAFKRAYNTFGEDPLLTSQIGAAEIRGIQSQHVMAMAKHFIGFDTQGSDVWMDDRTLREVYLPPFEAAVAAGPEPQFPGTHSAMTASRVSSAHNPTQRVSTTY